MVIVKAQPGETKDSIIRKSPKKVIATGLLQDLRRKDFYQKPSEKRKEEKKLRERTRRR